MNTTNIFNRPMTWLSKVVLKPEEQSGDNIQTTTIGAFLAPEYQQLFAARIAEIRALCPTLEDKLRNEDRVKQLKIKLPAGVVSAVLQGGMGQDNETERNGVIAIDIDAKDNPAVHDWEALKQVVGQLPYVAYAGLSVSGLGIFALIPVADPMKHKQHFDALVRHFAQMEVRLLQEGEAEETQMEVRLQQECEAEETVLQGLVLDPAPSNIASKRFVSYDPAPVWKTEAEVYEDTLEPAAGSSPSTTVPAASSPSATVPGALASGPSHFTAHPLEPRPNMLRGLLRKLFEPLPARDLQPFDLEGFLQDHRIPYEARSRQGGTQYIVQCPWQELHSSHSHADSAIFRYPDGRIGYKCLHAHCAGRTWHDFRAFYDPDAYAWMAQ